MTSEAVVRQLNKPYKNRFNFEKAKPGNFNRNLYEKLKNVNLSISAHIHSSSDRLKKFRGNIFPEDTEYKSPT